MTTRKTLSSEELLELERRRLSEPSPLGRRGTPDEIASAVSFLASEESGYIDGQAINVCGAWVVER